MGFAPADASGSIRFGILGTDKRISPNSRLFCALFFTEPPAAWVSSPTFEWRLPGDVDVVDGADSFSMAPIS